MSVKKITAQEANTTLWSGGATTEYFVYPPQASYAKRDFEIRISSATVEESPSTFTSLPGYHRLLMPLDAPMNLTFAGEREVLLKPLESTSFDGGIETISQGTCTDFGVMLSEKWQGQLVALTEGTYPLGPGFSFVYAVEHGGTISWNAAEQKGTEKLEKGDFILFADEIGEIHLTLEAGKMVVAGRIIKKA